ncbi:MAG: hypothetical protein B6245_09760 [Desulfobacteraceae bacterium 4572_88]|nr:MAG: hypothetical protein B6245_09760 [Desulfobacteraceae bacterium 4572_88]
MNTLFDKIGDLWDFLILQPKSITTLLIALVIVIVIAFFVNRKRDASGRLSFVDKSRTGVIGVRIYETEEGYRKRNWLIPIWLLESNLLLNVRMLLPKGEYDIKAYWNPDVSHKRVFDAWPIQKLRAYSLSGVGKFKISEDTPIAFELGVQGKNMQIDSPDKSALEADSVKKPFPMILSDPSLGKIAGKFEKASKDKIWKLSVTDERIVRIIENEGKSVKRKLDDALVKNKELKSNLDQLMKKLRVFQEKMSQQKARKPAMKT